MQFNWLDGLIALILVISAVSGLRRGFMEAMGSIVGIIVAVFLAVIYHDDLVIFLEAKYGVISYLADKIKGELNLTALSITNPLVDHLDSPSLLSDPGGYLARLLVTAGAFIVILFMVKLIIDLVIHGLDSLFSHGVLDWMNRMLGMILVMVKNMLFLSIILGILYPVILTGANMGFEGAITTLAVVDNSKFATSLLGIFSLLKALIGFNA
ncbi:MAG: CvpA family protein [Syntrophomonadaceae bacterium]|jgi:hypothetical protein